MQKLGKTFSGLTMTSLYKLVCLRNATHYTQNLLSLPETVSERLIQVFFSVLLLLEHYKLQLLVINSNNQRGHFVHYKLFQELFNLSMLHYTTVLKKKFYSRNFLKILYTSKLFRQKKFNQRRLSFSY